MDSPVIKQQLLRGGGLAVVCRKSYQFGEMMSSQMLIAKRGKQLEM